MDEELHRFKLIDLPQYAAGLGYQLVSRERTRSGSWRGSTAASVLMRHPTTDDKIVIRREADGHWVYFSVRDSRDNGTIVDFAQRRQALSLGTLRRELRGWIGVDPTRSPAPLPPYTPPAEVARRKREAIEKAFKQLRRVENNLYLNGRGIRPETLQSDRFKGTWFEDERGNAIFPHRSGSSPDDVCGWEKKNRGFTGFATDGVKTLWISRAKRGDNRLVFVESAIDALSYHQLHGDSSTRYASTGGSIGERLGATFIERAIGRMPADATVVTATDSDAQGEKYAQQIAERAGGRTVVRHKSPMGKDWNDCLQARESSYIREVTRHLRPTLSR